MGLLTANLDSPMHSSWLNTKYSNASTERPCQACKVKKSDLGDPNYNVKRNARTADGILRDLAYVSAGNSKPERTARSKRKGVVVGAFPNPLAMVVYDPVQQTGMDIIHQVCCPFWVVAAKDNLRYYFWSVSSFLSWASFLYMGS